MIRNKSNDQLISEATYGPVASYRTRLMGSSTSSQHNDARSKGIRSPSKPSRRLPNTLLARMRTDLSLLGSSSPYLLVQWSRVLWSAGRTELRFNWVSLSNNTISIGATRNPTQGANSPDLEFDFRIDSDLRVPSAQHPCFTFQQLPPDEP